MGARNPTSCPSVDSCCVWYLSPVTSRENPTTRPDVRPSPTQLNSMGTLCCLCILFGAGKSKSMAILILAKFDINPRERRQMLSKCQLIMATGGTVAQDLTMQWSTSSGFMQDPSLMVIDEGQQYGTDREIAAISLLKQQPLVLWTGDAQQTPGGIARTAPNAKRSRRSAARETTTCLQT